MAMASSYSDRYVEALRAYYNNVGQQYDQGSMSEWHRKAANTLLDAAGPAIQKGSWVLDLATGTGNGAFAAAERVGSTGRVLGVDISDGFLAIANRKAAELGVQSYVEFLNQDVAHLDLPGTYTGAKRFDAVVSASAFPLFLDPGAVLRVVATELLRPGGVFVVDSAHGNVLAKLSFDLAAAHGIPSPINALLLTDPEVGFHKLFGESGFEVKSIVKKPHSGSSTMKWDVSNDEALETLWERMVVKAPWVSFGLDELAPEVKDNLKRDWLKGAAALGGPEGVIVPDMSQYVVVASPKSG